MGKHMIPEWITILSALLTPGITILAGFIGYRQWRTAQDKLRLDLFERRLAIHGVVSKLIRTVLKDGKVDLPARSDFLIGTRPARWLFDDGMVQYFDNEIFPKVNELSALTSELEGLPVGAERSANVQKQREIKEWLLRQLRVLDGKFDRFLKFPP
jgi:hypothetical protein